MSERRVLILARQSLTHADSVSIRVQRETLIAHYEARGDRVVGVLESENTRGWKEDRADLSEAVARARNGDYDVLGVWSIDRLARSVRILEIVVHDLKQEGVVLDSYSESWAGDDFMRAIAGAIAQKFTADLSARMRGVVSFKVAQGKHQGPPPFGFVRGDDDRLEPGPHADAAAAMFAYRIQGLGRRAIAERLKRDHGVSIDPGSVLRNLRNPAYAGAVTGPGGALVWDAHEAIVPRELWERVQTLLTSRARVPRSGDAHWLEGLAYCGCGATLYRNKTSPYGIMLRCGNLMSGRGCSNYKHGIDLDRAAALVVAQFAADLQRIADAHADAVVAHLTASQRAASPSWDKERTRLEKQRARLLEKRERAVEVRIDGGISREEFRQKVAAIDTQVAETDAALAAGPQPIDVDRIRRTIEAAREIGKRIPDLAIVEPGAFRTALVNCGARFWLYDPPVLVYDAEFAAVLGALSV